MSRVRSYDQEEIIEVYDKYKQGLISNEDWFMCVRAALKDIIRASIRQTHRQTMADYDDYEQEAYVAIFEDLDSYNPRESAITTFFVPRIQAAFGKCAESFTDTLKRLNKHERRSYNKMEKAVEAFGFTGLDDPRLDETMIAQISDQPITTVIRVLSKVNRTLCSFEEIEETQQSLGTNPLDVITQNESAKLYNELMASLTEFEKYIAYSTFLDDKRKSNLTIVKELNSGLLQEFNDDTLPEKANQKFVNSSINRVIQKMRKHPMTRRWMADQRDLEEDYWEQAQITEIQNAWAEGLLA